MAFRDIFRGSRNTIKDSFTKSQDWLKDMVDSLFRKTNDNTTRTNDDEEKKKLNYKAVNYPEMGKMYFFMYHDPKYRKILPYWDKFPLVITVQPEDLRDGPGMLGLNLHYLPIMDRIALLDALILNYNDASKTGDERKLAIRNYSVIKSFLETQNAKQCIKKYYFSRILASSRTKARFAEIHPDDWKFVATIPSLEQWMSDRGLRP